MTIVLFSTPAYGHLLAQLPLVAALTSRGHHVTAYSTPAFQGLIEDTGATFRDYPFDFSRFSLDRVTADFLVLYETLLTVNAELLAPIEEILAAQRPELVLHDSLAGFAKHACQRLGLRAVCLTSTLAFNSTVFATSNLWLSSMKLALRRPLRMLRLGLRERRYRQSSQLKDLRTLDLFVSSEPLTLVFAPPFFQPQSASFDGRFVFAGPPLEERIARPWGRSPQPSSDKPLAYLSLGTIFSRQRGLLSAMTEELAELGFRLIVSTSEPLTRPPRLEDHEFQVGSGWNQLDVLSRAALFVNHGGVNGVLEALWFGIPQIFLPRQDEQVMTSRRAHRLGVGIELRRFTPAALRLAIGRVRSAALDRHIAKAREQLRSETKTADEVATLVELATSSATPVHPSRHRWGFL